MEHDFKDFCVASINSIITTNDSIKWSPDNKISVIQKEFIEVFKLQLNITQIVPKTSYERCILQVSQEYPTEKTDIEINDFMHRLDKISLYNCVLDPLLCPRLDKCKAVQPEFIFAQWSSRDLVRNESCALLTLTNLGFAQVYIYQNNTIVSIGNVNDFWLSEVKKEWRKPGKEGIKTLFEIHKIRAHQLHITALTWSSYKDTYSYFITGHSSGDVAVWKISKIDFDNPKFEPELMMKFNVIQSSVCSISSHKNYLFVGYNNGQIVGYVFSKEKLIIDSEYKFIWPDEDKIKIMSMKIIEIESCLVIIIVKGQYIIAILLDTDLKTIDTVTTSVGTYYITGIEQITSNEFITTSISGDIINITILLKPENRIELKQSSLSSSIDTINFGIFGISSSKSKAIWAFLISPVKSYDHLVLKQPSFLKFCSSIRFSPIEMLKNNTSEMLTDYWECMDFLRQGVLQQKALPYWPVYSSSSSIYELKILYWLSSELDLVVKRQARPVPFDITFTKKLYDQIISRHMLKLFNKLFEKYIIDVSEATILDLRILRNCRDFFQNYATSDSLQIELQNDIKQGYEKLQQVDVNMPLEICTWCKKDLIGLKCPNNHQFSSCMITMLPTSNLEYLICPVCERVALSELLYTRPLCIFCDTLLIKQTFVDQINIEQ